MVKKGASVRESNRFGIAEWYGRPVSTLSFTERRDLAARAESAKPGIICPYRQASVAGALCNKKGGVCSLRVYERTTDGSVGFSKTRTGLVTMCPSRFWEDNTVFREIGRQILACDKPVLIKEVGFLASTNEEDFDRDVGRIDTVLVNPNTKPLEWCAIEMQAVYFSGGAMSSEFASWGQSRERYPFPTKQRRPDFRSSGPKRLLPQLQIKVPTLSRWGRKMAVVVDQAFFNELATMEPEKHVSNADIAWFVVSYAPENHKLQVSAPYYTTLASSVVGLTAGRAVSQPEFESELQRCLANPELAKRGKVIRLA